MADPKPSPGQTAILAGLILLATGALVIFRAQRGDGTGLVKDGSRPEPARAVPSASAIAPVAEPSRAPLPADVVREPIRFELVLYFAGEPTPEGSGASKAPVDPMAALETRHGQGYRRLTRVERIDAFTATPAIAAARLGVERVPPPPRDALARAGDLDAAGLDRLAHASRALVVAVQAGANDARFALGSVERLVADVADDTAAIVCDRESNRCWSHVAWRAALGDGADRQPRADREIAVVVRPDGELRRITSAGMGKLGLPDLVVERIPGSFEGLAAGLVLATCQTLIERGRLDGPGRLVVDLDRIESAGVAARLEKVVRAGAKRRVEIRLVVAQPRDGDGGRRFAEITFVDESGRGLAERQRDTLVQLFGAEDSVARAPAADPDLDAASRRARARLPALRQAFERGRGGGEKLFVKAPFRAKTGEDEWMWIEVLRWDGDSLHGVLVNAPALPSDLGAGAEVVVAEASVVDVMRKLADGGVEGDETGAVLGRRGDASAP